MEKIGCYELNKVYCEDCLEAMKKLPDNSIDLIITDPPYGDNIGYGRMGKTIENNEDESINYRFLDDIYSKLKIDSCIYLFTNWKFENKLREYIEKNTNFTTRMMIIIVKNNIGMGYSFRNQYEICLVIEKGKPKYHTNSFSNVLFMKQIIHNKDTHPHQKDEEIIRKILLHSSQEGDIVLDCFAGSGSLITSCKQLGRKFLGFEIESKYCDITNERLKQKILW